jgi:predicted nucleic acid-binding protein
MEFKMLVANAIFRHTNSLIMEIRNDKRKKIYIGFIYDQELRFSVAKSEDLVRSQMFREALASKGWRDTYMVLRTPFMTNKNEGNEDVYSLIPD